MGAIQALKANYHTHTFRCRHAEGGDEAYVQEAIRGGFQLLGFADHVPWPFAGGYVSPIRMPMSELPYYIESVQELREKYAGQIDIRLGAECEYIPRYHDHLLRLRDMGMSYFILGAHYLDSEEDSPYVSRSCRADDGVRAYAEATAKAMRTGLFLYLAHPDLYMRHRCEDFNACCEEAADMLCQTALELNMPLEYNLGGLDEQLNGEGCGYPSDAFWRYARKWNNPVILGVDAHRPSMLSDLTLWNTARTNLHSLGYRIVDDLEPTAKS